VIGIVIAFLALLLSLPDAHATRFGGGGFRSTFRSAPSFRVAPAPRITTPPRITTSVPPIRATPPAPPVAKAPDFSRRATEAPSVTSSWLPWWLLFWTTTSADKEK
jgi:hypothetical protein